MSTKRIRILFVMLSLYNGGAEKSLVNLLNELSPEKYDISLFLLRKEGLFLNQVPDYVRIIEPSKELKCLYGKVSLFNIHAYPLYFVKVLGTLISKLFTSSVAEEKYFRWNKFYSHYIPQIEESFDIVAAYITLETMFFASDKIPNGKKYYTWVHNDYISSGFSRKCDYPYFCKMDKVNSISNECVAILKEIFPEIQNKFIMIPNITSSKIIRRRASEFWPSEFRENSFNIISIGRLSEQKGFDIAIKSAKILKDKGVKFQWYVIGSGNLKKKLQTQIEINNILNEFHLIGVRDNPYPYIKYCNLVIQTSRWEGKSVVLDEAKILQKPILVTDYATVRDQILDGKEGIITRIDANSIADALINLIEDNSKLEKLTCYLSEHEYGNQNDIEIYMDLFD